MLDASQEVGLKVNTEISTHPRPVTDYRTNSLYKSSENMTKFKFLQMTETNQNCNHEKIKSWLNFENACYHALHDFWLPAYQHKRLKRREI
jgi:hypothetical protein